ncbi:phosphoribosylglycinamide formyltransferase [Patescibacteria group bacterium]|nr:phosphoribosylglycinamide formyltransferase [Patescibacteria group bacterium]
MRDQLRLALFISGGGSTAQAIIRASKSGRLAVQPTCVIASTNRAKGIQLALQEGMAPEDILVLKPKEYATPEAFGEAILAVCRARDVDLIGQYGWMPKTPTNVITAFLGRMINQHPGPLDPGRSDFGGKGMFGKRVHAARLWFVRKTRRDFWTEATAQLVAEQFDKGALLKTQRLKILEDDDPESLQSRLLLTEHEVQIATLQDFATGQIKVLPPREHPLVFPNEESLLKEAKQVAHTLFPQG